MRDALWCYPEPFVLCHSERSEESQLARVSTAKGLGMLDRVCRVGMLDRVCRTTPDSSPAAQIDKCAQSHYGLGEAEGFIINTKVSYGCNHRC